MICIYPIYALLFRSLSLLAHVSQRYYLARHIANGIIELVPHEIMLY
ncbi:hypothetical protein HanIR_Chr13g0642481 [Helianthus annuus]|nr:hypothetical protein HanIR_Chr13g0642481 [Helianthus annuus]